MKLKDFYLYNKKGKLKNSEKGNIINNTVSLIGKNYDKPIIDKMVKNSEYKKIDIYNNKGRKSIMETIKDKRTQKLAGVLNESKTVGIDYALSSITSLIEDAEVTRKNLPNTTTLKMNDVLQILREVAEIIVTDKVNGKNFMDQQNIMI